MTDKAHAQFTGSIPEYYDRYLGPLLFEPQAEDIAALARELRDRPLRVPLQAHVIQAQPAP